LIGWLRILFFSHQNPKRTLPWPKTCILNQSVDRLVFASRS